MYFPAKRDRWFGLLTLGSLAGIFVVFSVLSMWFAALPVILILIFFGWFWFGSGYKVTETSLLIKYGPFRKVIPLEEVIAINQLNGNRLKLIYGNAKRVSITPAESWKFLDLMKNSCPLLGIKMQKL